MIVSRSQVRVRYAETDMMGIVYHGSYLPWFEIARTDMLRAHGLRYLDMEAEGYRLPVLSVEVKYVASALYDDELTIVATLAEKPRMRMRITYEVLRGETKLATGATEHAFIDRQGRPVRPPPRFTAKMEELFG